MSLYDLSAKLNNGRNKKLADYKGKVLLIVNTASKCGFTPQYEGLQSLYAKYKDRGLEVLGFPCDQFGHQEPGSDDEIKSFCQVNYGVDFPLFSKIDVNGDDAHPVFKFLKSEKGGLLGDSIKWNFTKFLVDKKGNVVERFAPTTPPTQSSRRSRSCWVNKKRFPPTTEAQRTQRRANDLFLMCLRQEDFGRLQVSATVERLKFSLCSLCLCGESSSRSRYTDE